ncbi:hemerythrin domain-containing protein [Variovorax sp. PBL-E5]|uniref:hemerythrin domain-containing protein n=1 Tax=Variovorax sp. PBL-E5 TaxID=434014 RepID=UPI00131946A2|nr:hemerythrin domain-containing protein [Variovorax sp. PBL-E5]VTU23216.1 hypothetical protein E5CHR_01546 [Variovorax sp. PBL-E5]
MNARTPCATRSSAASAPPLALHLAGQDRLRQQCASLRSLAHRLDEPDAAQERESIRTALNALSQAFQVTLEWHRSDQEVDLFPALLESMAGSDAVCIRQMADDLTAEHRALEARWHRVRAALDAVAEGGNAGMPSAEVDALASLCERHTAFEDAELLPMAERLLSDPELARLAHAMAERREEL